MRLNTRIQLSYWISGKPACLVLWPPRLYFNVLKSKEKGLPFILTSANGKSFTSSPTTTLNRRYTLHPLILIEQ